MTWYVPDKETSLLVFILFLRMQEGVSSSDKVSTSTDQLPPMKVEAQTEGSPHGDNTLTWLELATEKVGHPEHCTTAKCSKYVLYRLTKLRMRSMLT